jgi:hypothetical protein
MAGTPGSSEIGNEGNWKLSEWPDSPPAMSARSTNPAPRPRRSSKVEKARRAARTLAQGTLLAAGMVAVQIGGAEVDSRFQLFDPNLLDRLHAPITRLHE